MKEQETQIWRVLTSATILQFPIKFCNLAPAVLFRDATPPLVKGGVQEIRTLHRDEVSLSVLSPSPGQSLSVEDYLESS